MTYYIYIITHAATGRVYVGQTINPAKRWYSHKRANGCTYISNAIQKYGSEEFTFVVTHEGLTRDEAAAMEVAEIARLDSMNPLIGFNIAPGGKNTVLYGEQNGMFGRHWTEEENLCRTKPASEDTKKKMSETHTGMHHSSETKAKMSAWQVGRTRPAEFRANLSKAKMGTKASDETKAKMSLARKGKKQSEETRLKRAMTLASKKLAKKLIIMRH